MTTLDRFRAKVDVQGPDDCWNWTGATIRGGYGHAYVGGPARTMILAHRLSALLAFGPFDRRLMVCHRCDNPPCVNPAHLFIGTQFDNQRDKTAKGRHHKQRVTACPAGHPYSDENTYISPRGERVCRACRRHNQLNYRTRKKAS